jgi:K(+)-stimulated pyrophosphate-energized sodium pump
MGMITAIGFLIGAVASYAAGYIGMRVSVIANVRTAEAAKKGMAAGLNHGFQRRFRNRYDGCRFGPEFRSWFLFCTQDVVALVALGFGGSLISIFARLGGGIFTKGADVGADLGW